MFPDLSSAQEAQRRIQKFDEEGLIKLASSVVIVKSDDSKISQSGGHTPGALGAGLGGIVGGILGLVGGPAVSAMAANMSPNSAALLGEAINPSDEAKRVVEENLTKLGGAMVGKNFKSEAGE